MTRPGSALRLIFSRHAGVSLHRSTRSGKRSAVQFLCLAAVSAMLTVGCAATKPNDIAASLPDAPIFTRPDGSVRIDTANEEVAKLWASAESARAKNRPTVALELLYEALELDPGNSLVWSRAAEIQLDNLEPTLAEDFATRSNSFASENRPLLHRNWLIIEHSRSMRGDLLGVRSAHKEVQSYQYQ